MESYRRARSAAPEIAGSAAASGLLREIRFEMAPTISVNASFFVRLFNFKQTMGGRISFSGLFIFLVSFRLTTIGRSYKNRRL